MALNIAAQQDEQEASLRRVLHALTSASVSAPCPVAALIAATGINDRTMTRHLKVLQDRDQIKRAGKRGGAWLTARGRAVLGEPTGTSEATEVTPAPLRTVLAALPCEEYRAVVRLVVAACIARYHLRNQIGTGHPGAVIAGQTNVGKTQVIYRAVCVALGLDEQQHSALLAGRSKGQILGRSVQRPGSGWEFVPAAALSRPLVAYDEAHEADGEPVQALRDLLHGATRVEGEHGAQVDVAPTVFVLGNLDTGDPFVGRYAGSRVLPLPRNLARRSILLDTRPLDSIRPAVPEAARALEVLGNTMRPLSLSRCRPAAAELPADARTILSSVTEVLTAEGIQLFDVRALEVMTLGMSALLPAAWGADRRCRVAAAFVALDYVATRSTIKGTLRASSPSQTAPIREWLAAEVGDDVPADLIPTARLTEMIEAEDRSAEAAEDRRQREKFSVERALILDRIDKMRSSLPKSPANWWSEQDREALIRHRSLLGARRKSIEREFGAGGIRVAAGAAGARAALTRLDPLAREAGEAIDAAHSWKWNMDRTVPPSGTTTRGSSAPPVPRAASRSRKPRRGQVPVAGANWIPKAPR